MKPLQIPICICLLALLLIIHPVLFLNDEWITVNQISQLSEHKQILYNEGKYGTYPNGTPYAYFTEKENILPYTSFFPIISYPFLILIQGMGDILPYYISILFSLLLLFLAIIIKDRFEGMKFTKALIGFAFVTLLLNLVFYRSIQITGENTSIEILAVVITHIFIFLLLVLVISFIMRDLFSDPTFVTFGLLTTIACSSYLFWTTTCKDHLDVAFAIAILVLFLIRFIRTTDAWYLFSAFITTGLLTWIRPELGSFIFLTVLLITILHILTRKESRHIRSCMLLLLTPLGTCIGIIPLFVSNLCTTGHPLTFPFQMIASVIKAPKVTDLSVNAGGAGSLGDFFNLSWLPDSVSFIVTMIGTRLTLGVPAETLFSNLYATCISPTTLKVPIFALVPLFILGLYFLPALIKEGTRKLGKDEKSIIISMLLLALGTGCAYLISIGGLHTSVGIYPDIRYLSPVYIPLNIIGLVLLSHVLTDSAMIKRVVYYALATAIGASCCMPFILGTLYRLYGFWDIFLWLNGIVTVIIYALLLICLLLVFGWYKGIFHLPVLTLPLAFLIAVPLIWQITMIMLTNFSIGGEYHYPPLLPMVRELFDWIQQ